MSKTYIYFIELFLLGCSRLAVLHLHTTNYFLQMKAGTREAWRQRWAGGMVLPLVIKLFKKLTKASYFVFLHSKRSCKTITIIGTSISVWKLCELRTEVTISAIYLRI